MESKIAREIMREHQRGFAKLNPRWCAIDRLIEDSEKLEQVERKKGKWIYVGDNCFKCSECGEVYTIDQFNHINNYCDNRFPKGCPTCATEMENEE